MTVNGVQKLDYVPQKTKFYRFVMMNKSLHEFSFLGELMKENWKTPMENVAKVYLQVAIICLSLLSYSLTA